MEAGDDEIKMQAFFKNLEKNIENHAKTQIAKNVCSFLWLSEFEIVKIYEKSKKCIFFKLKSLNSKNNGKDDGLVVEEKVGFKAGKTWFLFAEEAIYLFFLKKIAVFVLKDEKCDQIEFLQEEKSDFSSNIREINDFSCLYYELYSKNALKSKYNRMHISIMYNFFRRKGNFLKRLSI